MAIPYATEDQLNQLESKLSKKIETIAGGGTTLDIPTKTSDLENDSGFITSEALSDYYTKTETDALIAGIETGGSTTIDAYTKAETDSLLADKADTSSLTALSSEVTALSSSLGTLETAVEGKADTSAITTLTGEVTTLSSSVATLTSAVSTLSTAVDALVEVPAIPSDATEKTYVLKIVSGTLTWVEETAGD